MFYYNPATFAFLSLLIFLLGVAIFFSGIYYQNHSIPGYSPKQNPYISEMYFDSPSQKQIYENHWFIPTTRRLII
jgi:hypothetical protein